MSVGGGRENEPAFENARAPGRHCEDVNGVGLGALFCFPVGQETKGLATLTLLIDNFIHALCVCVCLSLNIILIGGKNPLNIWVLLPNRKKNHLIATIAEIFLLMLLLLYTLHAAAPICFSCFSHPDICISNFKPV